MLEKLFYESKPFLYIVLAIYALTHPFGGVLRLSGTILFGCAVAVFYWRVKYRSSLR